MHAEPTTPGTGQKWKLRCSLEIRKDDKMTTEKSTNEARQGSTSNGTGRRVLGISLALAIICLGAVVYFYTM